MAIRETLQRRGEKAQYQHYERQAIPMKESIIKQLKDEIEYYKDRIESAKKMNKDINNMLERREMKVPLMI